MTITVARAVEALASRAEAVSPNPLTPDGVRLRLIGMDVDVDEMYAVGRHMGGLYGSDVEDGTEAPRVVCGAAWTDGFLAGLMHAELRRGEGR